MNCNTKSKNKNYETLTGRHSALKQRYEISALLQLRRHSANISQKEIALQVGVSESTISNEKKRNKKSNDLYDADVANNLAAKRRKDKKMYKFDKNIKNSIENLLEKQYSPEQIVGVLKKENTVTMSHEWIYHGQPMLYIYQDKKNGGKLYENFRQKRKNRKKRLLEGEKRGVIPNKVMIVGGRLVIDHQKLKQEKDMEIGKGIR